MEEKTRNETFNGVKLGIGASFLAIFWFAVFHSLIIHFKGLFLEDHPDLWKMISVVQFGGAIIIPFVPIMKELTNKSKEAEEID